MSAPQPTELRLEKSQRVLVIDYDDGAHFELPCYYLRTHSPSAEVRGHGLSEPKVLPGKEAVNIERIEPVGNYAVTLIFDDGHKTGIYSWSFLYELGVNMDANMEKYRHRLAQQS